MKNGLYQVLLVVDMQNDFVHENGSLYVHKGKLSHREINDVVGNVCKLIDNGDPWDVVIATLDTHYGNYADTLEGKMLPVAHCVIDTWGHEIHDDVKNAMNGNYHPIEKYTFGHVGFVGNDVAFALDYQNDLKLPEGTRGGELEIHVCGVCTSICVLANAVILRAKYPDARIVVHSEACADVLIEAHEAALKILQVQQCEVV